MAEITTDPSGRRHVDTDKVVEQHMFRPVHPYCHSNNTEFVENAAGKWMVYRCLDCKTTFEIDGE